MPKPWFIAVSGVMGVGKTTLSKSLAAAFGWQYVHGTYPATGFLNDLFSNPQRWAFETQTAFLVHKAIQIEKAIHGNHSFVLDRTLFEDVEIFARHFYDKGHINKRPFDTYSVLANHFLQQLPPPDLLVHCECPLIVIKQRLSKRRRSYDSLYPPEHVQELHDRYETWSRAYNRGSIYQLDTESMDIRKAKVISALANEIADILANSQQLPFQLDLFDHGQQSKRNLDPLLTPLFQQTVQTFDQKAPIVKIPQKSRAIHFPTAYIAAPFTGYAEEPEMPPGLLFDLEFAHGIIQPGRYQDFLLGIESSLRKLGIHSLIPHRDVNKWGKCHLTPKMASKLCTQHVSEADIFVGLLGTSHGSHYEFGIALGMNKPSILLRCKEIPQSFIGSGIEDYLGPIKILNFEKMEDVKGLLLTDDVRLFLSKYVPIHWRK